MSETPEAKVSALTGDVEMIVAGVKYLLKFEHLAIMAMEARLKVSVKYLPALMMGEKYTHARVMMWAALRAHHEELDEDAAGLLVVKLGLDETFVKLKEAVQAAFPEPEAPSPQL